jgi:hypothetical protein
MMRRWNSEAVQGEADLSESEADEAMAYPVQREMDPFNGEVNNRSIVVALMDLLVIVLFPLFLGIIPILLLVVKSILVQLILMIRAVPVLLVLNLLV